MTDTTIETPTETDARASKARDIARVRQILADVRPLAAEYYRLTGKPLGVTGEVAEFIAAEHLGLELADARTAGYDAVRHGPDGPVHTTGRGRSRGSGLAGSRRTRDATQSFWSCSTTRLSIRVRCGRRRSSKL